MTPGEYTIEHSFNHRGKEYDAIIYHALELSEEEKRKHLIQEDTYLVILKTEEEEKTFELFINAGDTYWSTKSDLIDPAIVEILGNEIDHRSK